ncbi:uncharacterized protein LOC142590460 isoform X2 [Dermacentor variabilis]|uniref:uncharacterized protein LOC142590460 isoform X2 n=1 Tax=Dermacentor variabilis TaxID=34621 RepID=UPI003F5C6B2C
MLQSGALPFGKQRSSALLYQPKDAVTILAACAALHKITLKAGEPELEDSDGEDEENEPLQQGQLQIGHVIIARTPHVPAVITQRVAHEGKVVEERGNQPLLSGPYLAHNSTFVSYTAGSGSNSRCAAGPETLPHVCASHDIPAV